jgi:hypothetical protein
MAHPLDSARLKVERAWQHLDQLNGQMRTFFDAKPVEFLVAPAPDEDRWYVVYARVRRPIPEQMSLIFGDAVHNLRSALDHLAYQLAAIGTGPTRQTKWPVFDDEAKFSATGTSYLDGMREQHRTRVTDLQPFKDPDGLRWLSLLHGLDIADKHHVLGRGVTAPTRADLTVTPGLVEVLAQGSRVEVEDGTEVLRFRVADTTATPEVSLRAGFQFAAFFGDAGCRAAPGAISLWSYGVRDIIESFASDFR